MWPERRPGEAGGLLHGRYLGHASAQNARSARRLTHRGADKPCATPRRISPIVTPMLSERELRNQVLYAIYGCDANY
jgi:hypothetical protein